MAKQWVYIANLMGPPGDANAMNRFEAIEAWQDKESQRTSYAIALADEALVYRNVLSNPGPDALTPSWTSGWAGGNGTREFVPSTSAPSRTGYLHLTWTSPATGTNVSVIAPGSNNASPGILHSGSIQVRSSKATVMAVTLYFYNSAGDQIGDTVYNRKYRVPANEWTLLEINGYRSPSGTVSVRLGVAASAQGGAAQYATGDTLDVSAAICTPSGRVRPYLSGSWENGYWDGAANASSSRGSTVVKLFGEPFGSAPSCAGARAGGYNQDKRLYVPTAGDLGPMRRRIAKALRGEDSYHLAWIGHSIVAGQGGTPGVADNVKWLLNRAMQAGKTSAGVVYAYNNTTRDARVSYTAGFTAKGSPQGNMQSHVGATTVGQTYTHASDTPGTVVEIYTYGNSGPMSYSIDGAAPVTITPSGQAAGQLTRITGLADTKHTVVIATLSTTASYVLGVAVSYPTGFRASNFGYSGCIAEDWQPGGIFYSGYKNVVDFIKPDGVVIELGANELIHSVGVNSLVANLKNVIPYFQFWGMDVLLIVDPPVESATRTTWESVFRPALYDVADAMGVPMVDFSSHWVNRDLAVRRNLYADQWHPNDAGYFDLHNLVPDVLLP